MIIGNGLFARAFRELYQDRNDTIIFASGVSNSREEDPAAFQREQRLLEAALNQGKRLVYFGTCSLLDPHLKQAPYVAHKTLMEQMVMSGADNAVLRIPQVLGNTPNPNTLGNFLYNKISSGNHFEVWQHATRNLIDIDDVVRIAHQLLEEHRVEGEVTSIARPYSTKMPHIVATFERVLGTTANCTLIDAGESFDIETAKAASVAEAQGIDFSAGYLDEVIAKYYAQRQARERSA